MALKVTAQSGDFSGSATWVGGVVPDPAVDDVEVIAPNTLTLDVPVTIAAGRTWTIDGDSPTNTAYLLTQSGGGDLTIYGTLSIYGHSLMSRSIIINSGGVVQCLWRGDLDQTYGYLQVHQGAEIDVNLGGSLDLSHGYVDDLDNLGIRIFVKGGYLNGYSTSFQCGVNVEDATISNPGGGVGRGHVVGDG